MVSSSKNHNYLAGITLVEIILYIAVSSLFAILVSTFYFQIQGSAIKQDTVKEINYVALNVSNEIERALSFASSITAPIPNTTAANLEVSSQLLSEDPTLIYLNGQNLEFSRDSVATQINPDAIEVTGLEFTHVSGLGGNGVEYQFTLTHSNPESVDWYDYTRSYDGVIWLRY